MDEILESIWTNDWQLTLCLSLDLEQNNLIEKDFNLIKNHKLSPLLYRDLHPFCY